MPRKDSLWEVWIWSEAWILAAIPFLRLIYLLYEYHVDVPYLDQWWMLPLIVADRENRLPFAFLWMQNAEHRLFVPKLVMLGLARISDWDTTWELAFNVGVMMTFAAVIFYQLRATLSGAGSRHTTYALPFASIMAFSVAAFENWQWSWQMSYFIVALCVAGICCLLSLKSTKRWSLYAAAALACVATFSFGSGLAAWVSGGVVILMATGTVSQRRRRFLGWCLAMAVSVAVFLIDYQFKTWSDPGAALASPVQFLEYFFAFLSGPVVPTHWVTGGILTGILLTIILPILVSTLVRRFGARIHVLAPYIGWIAFSYGSALMTALGRSGAQDTQQALTARYITLSQFAWAGLAVLLYVASLEAKRASISGASRVFRRLAIIVVLLLINASLRGERGLEGMSWKISEGAGELRILRSRTELKRLFADPDRLRDEFVPMLRKYKLSVYRE